MTIIHPLIISLITIDKPAGQGATTVSKYKDPYTLTEYNVDHSNTSLRFIPAIFK